MATFFNMHVKNDDTLKRYFAFSDYLKQTFGAKVHKVSIHAGFTCPNRDGTLGTGGCIFCNNQGFSPNAHRDNIPVSQQINDGIAFLRKKYHAEKFIAYFQAYTNTYGPYARLKQLYDEALDHPDVVGLSVGTRPDCLDDDVLDLLADYARTRQVWIELGLQSMHDATLERINRHHDVATFVDAARRIRQRPGLRLCAHIILGLPGETPGMMLASAPFLSDLGIHGIKIHLLHVLRDTRLEQLLADGEIQLFSLDEYVSLVCDYLELLDPGIVIQRLTADGPADLLVAPRWALEKKKTLDRIEKELLKRNSRQGERARSGNKDINDSVVIF
jgi:uncharacterized protein